MSICRKVLHKNAYKILDSYICSFMLIVLVTVQRWARVHIIFQTHVFKPSSILPSSIVITVMLTFVWQSTTRNYSCVLCCQFSTKRDEAGRYPD